VVLVICVVPFSRDLWARKLCLQGRGRPDTPKTEKLNCALNMRDRSDRIRVEASRLRDESPSAAREGATYGRLGTYSQKRAVWMVEWRITRAVCARVSCSTNLTSKYQEPVSEFDACKFRRASASGRNRRRRGVSRRDGDLVRELLARVLS
jgi:hypothetical protein